MDLRSRTFEIECVSEHDSFLLILWVGGIHGSGTTTIFFFIQGTVHQESLPKHQSHNTDHPVV